MLLFFSLLLLAHLAADFPLQTNWIFAQKERGWRGGLWHAGCVGACIFIALLPWISNAAVAAIAAGIWVLHYIQDGLKVRLWDWRRKDILIGFVGDQLGHFGVILLASWLLAWLGSPALPGFEIWQQPELIWLGIGLILASYGWDTASYILRVWRGYRGPLVRDYPGMLARSAIIAAAFGFVFFAGN